MALPVAGIVAYFDGAVGALVLLYVSETCSRWEAPRLLGEDAGSPGCQHPQFNQSPQRKLPLSPTGPLDHQRRMAGLSEVQKNPFLLVVYIDLYGCPPLKYLEVILFITQAATLSELSWIDPARFLLTPGTKQSSSPY